MDRVARWRRDHPDRARELVRRWQPRSTHTHRAIGAPVLTPAQVREIRRRLQAGERRKAVALAFGTSYNTIRRIETGQTYLEHEYQVDPRAGEGE